MAAAISAVKAIRYVDAAREQPCASYRRFANRSAALQRYFARQRARHTYQRVSSYVDMQARGYAAEDTYAATSRAKHAFIFLRQNNAPAAALY